MQGSAREETAVDCVGGLRRADDLEQLHHGHGVEEVQAACEGSGVGGWGVGFGIGGLGVWGWGLGFGVWALMQWRLPKRSERLVALAIAAIERLLVFDAKIQEAGAAASMAAKIFCLSAKFSVTASIARSALTTAAAESVPVAMRPITAATF